VGSAGRELEWAARRYAEHSSLGVEQVEERVEVTLVRSASMEEHEQARWLANGRANEIREWVRWHSA
jgi:hypothetical protein